MEESGYFDNKAGSVQAKVSGGGYLRWQHLSFQFGFPAAERPTSNCSNLAQHPPELCVFCKPIKFSFAKETVELTGMYRNHISQQIDNLQPTVIKVADKTVTAHHLEWNFHTYEVCLAYSWFRLPVHKLLVHIATVASNMLMPADMMSEERRHRKSEKRMSNPSEHITEGRSQDVKTALTFSTGFWQHQILSYTPYEPKSTSLQALAHQLIWHIC